MNFVIYNDISIIYVKAHMCRQSACATSVYWVSCHLERLYGEGSVHEAKNKDTGKKMLNLIIAKDKQGFVWG